ncbi:MAG: ACT domain-containing protein [Tractidigestivibacter sp.]|uniref:ACT domain-containing protein n=1 Tax=Tractidigestivibacter sp. TaxID=2847320 RepID=UPI003D8B1D5F
MHMADEENKDRAIITVLGADRAGIVAAVAGTLSDCSANILDISQTILQGIFTMTMLVDLSDSTVDFATLKSSLDQLSERLGVQITIQREEVFKFMYRL